MDSYTSVWPGEEWELNDEEVTAWTYRVLPAL